MNLLLMQHDYPPTVIMSINRRQYYTVLAHADRGNYTPLVNFVGHAVERSLDLYLEAGTAPSKPLTPEDTWRLLRDAAVGTPYS